MRFGLISLPTGPAKMLEAATVSEDLGYDALYAADHLFAYVAADWPFLDGEFVVARSCSDGANRHRPRSVLGRPD